MPSRQARPVILVVDDDDGVRQTLQLILEDDYDVVETGDATTALALAVNGPIDLALVDILMPEMDGLQFLERLRDVRPEIPAVVVSAIDRASTAATAMRLGAVDYLTKPFDERMLLDVLRAALRRTRQGASTAGPRRSALIFGASAPIVAGVTAALGHLLQVDSFLELPPYPALLGDPRPDILIIAVTEQEIDWLPRTVLLLEHFFGVPAVILPGVKNSAEIGFVCSPHHTVLKQPFTLTMLLDAIERAIPGLVPQARWHDDRVAAVINAIFDDCAAFDLRSVSRHFGVSPRYLMRTFRNMVGMSVGRYLTTVRAQTAAFLLEHTGTKIEGAATAVGFHDASHLSRVFVQLTGRRPGEFRSKAR